MFEPLSALDNIDSYRRLFTDVDFWIPYVRHACRKHGLTPCQVIRGAGVPGTCPTFVVEDRWLVKFFGRLFEGARAFAVEQEANRLVAPDPAIPAARVLASGSLDGADWPWPYLVYEYIPGLSVGEAREMLSTGDGLRIAREMGEAIRRLHALPLAKSAVFADDHGPYLRFLAEERAVCVQNQRAWGILPPRLVDQIDDFMPPLEDLVDRSRPPHLIHADLTRDHLLGQVENGRWHTLALIDFGDAMTGDLLYELAALYLDLFNGDPALLGAFLDAYGIAPDERTHLPRKALATCLLHRFNVFENMPPVQMNVDTLDALAETVWGPVV